MRRRLLVLILALVAVVLALAWLFTRDNSRVVPKSGGAEKASSLEPPAEDRTKSLACGGGRVIARFSCRAAFPNGKRGRGAVGRA